MACDHNWVWDSETKTTVTHKCSKCQGTNTQSKHHRDRPGRFYAVALLVMVVLGVALTIWAGGSA